MGSVLNLEFLKLPETTEIKDLDAPIVSEIHKEILSKKYILRKIYIDFYQTFKNALADRLSGLVVEIGSGGGFLKEVIPEVITTDVSPSPSIDFIIKDNQLPFQNNSVRAFFLQNVLHHVSNPKVLFFELERCLINGGKIIMIEPYVSLWGRFIYEHFHHEPCNVHSGWETIGTGRLTGANSALPWIIFCRDKKIFEKEFPGLEIKKIVPHTPTLYLISGGFSFKQLLPNYTYNFLKVIEVLLSPFNRFIGMFVTIELEKK